MNERRKADRLHVQIPVEVRLLHPTLSEQPLVQTGEIHNFSERGALLTLQMPWDHCTFIRENPHTPCRIDYRHDRGHETFCGAIVWAKVNEEDQHCQVGVFFKPTENTRIRQLVALHKAAYN